MQGQTSTIIERGMSRSTGHFLPPADDTYDLGSAALEWKDAYIDGIAYIDTLQVEVAALFGEDDLGVDVKMFGATAGAYLLWDESADKVIIDQSTVDTAILELASSTDVAHGATDFAATEVYAVFGKTEGAAGGLRIRGLKNSGGTDAASLVLAGQLGENTDTTKSTSGSALVEVWGSQLTGTGYDDVVADGNVFAVKARVGGAWVTELIVDEDGDLWLNGGITSSGAFACAADFVMAPSAYASSVEIGRGDTDTDITYIRLKNADAEDCYIYPNATQDAIIVSNTKP